MCTFYLEVNMDNKFLDLAIKYANKAYKLDEVPVGAVIVKDNEVIGYGYNKKEKNNSVLDHAELIAIKKAQKKLNNWRLNDCDIYISLDPCPMCASAIKQSRIKNVYSALNNSDENNLKIITEIFKKDKTNPEVIFTSNLNPEPVKKMLNSFFKNQRKY